MKAFTLVGVDNNAFSVIAYVSNAMKKVGYNPSDIQEYRKKATSGDYDMLIVYSLDILEKCNEKLSLKEDSCVEGEEFAKFGPGRYFIGDICYALPDEIYDNIWGNKYEYEDAFYKDEGFAVHRTAYGDGSYQGTDGTNYAVDAGNLGITKIDEAQRYDNSTLNNLGKIVEVKDSITMYCDDNCNFQFVVDGKYFEIITDGSDYEEDEDEDEE